MIVKEHMTPQEAIFILLTTLKRKYYKGTLHTPYGICGYITPRIYGGDEDNVYKAYFDCVMVKAVENWEHFSGNIKYPIILPYESTGFNKWFYSEFLYINTEIGKYFEGEYGRRRIELVHRMLNVIENEKLMAMNHIQRIIYKTIKIIKIWD